MTQFPTDPELTAEERGRYARHLTLPEFGASCQKRLKTASVLCVGAGGLGSPLLLYLTAAGVGRIGIVDDDCVEVSNLQRQVIHAEGGVGESKTGSARRRLLGLNSHCRVEEHACRLTKANAIELIESHDVVVDGSDNFPTRYLINDVCTLLNKPWVYGSVQRFEGQVSVFNKGPHSPDYRDLLPEPPPPGLIPSCADGGVVGVMPGLIGLIQAAETIKLLTGIGELLDGRLLLVDGLTMRFRELRLQRRPNRPAITNLIDYEQLCGVSHHGVATSDSMESVSVQELKQLMDSGEALVLVDVRNPSEAEVAEIPGAELIPLSLIESGEAVERIRSIAEGKSLFIHCKLGGRSAKAVQLLKIKGIKAVNVSGGIDAWSKFIDQSLPRY